MRQGLSILRIEIDCESINGVLLAEPEPDL